MLIVKVKICGITNYKDAAAALDMGADLLGFNFYPASPRFITPEIRETGVILHVEPLRHHFDHPLMVVHRKSEKFIECQIR